MTVLNVSDTMLPMLSSQYITGSITGLNRFAHFARALTDDGSYRESVKAPSLLASP